MKVLFQTGIPDVFFPALEEKGCRIERFPTESAAAQNVFDTHSDSEAIFFRANFSLKEKELSALPRLKTAALVSTGSDNIDSDVLLKWGINLVTGEGANAHAVFDYVVAALLHTGFNPEKQSVGIVGLGRIGRKVFAFLNKIGVRTFYFDPFLKNSGSLDAVLECDYVTFHVPLTRTGEHATEGMLNAEYFKRVQKTIRIIQTCRGQIWSPDFYRSLASHPHIKIAAQDVYPDEPPLASDLLLSQFSTPHIAGYSTRGRLSGILRGVKALFDDIDGTKYFPQSHTWDFNRESENFQKQVNNFNTLRDTYPWRKEFHEYDAKERAELRVAFPQIKDNFFEHLFEPS